MKTDFNNIFGQDFLLSGGNLGQAAAKANGELALASGEASAVQDIALRVFTRLGSLFYDQDFGSLIPDFIHDENTKENRLAFRCEVIRRIELDPRVLAGSVDCQIIFWDEKQIQAEATWVFWETEMPQNLSLNLERPLAKELTVDVAL